MGGMLSSRAASASVRMTSSDATSELVKNLITSDKVVIFSKTYCPYCKLAKEVFQKLKEKVTVIELDERNDCDPIQNVLGEMTGARSVPRVFINGNFVGGGSDVKALYDSGKLQPMIAG